MAIRLPTQVILDTTISETLPGAASVAGGIARPFLLPQDTDNVVLKVQAASVSGTGSITVLFQTSDDGGSTYYDVARTPAFGVSASQTTSVLNATAIWLSIPVIGAGMRSPTLPVSSTTTGVSQVSVLQATGSAAASTLGIGQVSGLPILGTANRVFLQYGGVVTTNDGIRIKVLANSQSSSE